MSYNIILVPFNNSKLSETALDHAIKSAKMSSISASSVNPPVKVTLLHVVQDIPALVTFGIGPFKLKKTGDILSLEQYLKEISTEIEIVAKPLVLLVFSDII